MSLPYSKNIFFLIIVLDFKKLPVLVCQGKWAFNVM